MVGPEENGQACLLGSDLAEIRQLVLNEALNVLQQAKDLIGDYLESDWPGNACNLAGAVAADSRGFGHVDAARRGRAVCRLRKLCAALVAAPGGRAAGR
jgi:hypothetical protein